MDTLHIDSQQPQQDNNPAADQKKDNRTLKAAGLAAGAAVAGAGAAMAANHFSTPKEENPVEGETTDTDVTADVPEAQAEPVAVNTHTAPATGAAAVPPASNAATATAAQEGEVPAQTETTVGTADTHTDPETTVTTGSTDTVTTDDVTITTDGEVTVTDTTDVPVDPGEDVPVIAEVEIDPDDIDLQAVVDFDQVGTIYTVDGDEFAAAHAFVDGEDIVMVDTTNDGIFDSVQIDGEVMEANLGGLNIGDAEVHIDEAHANYIPPTPGIDEPELPGGETFMDDIVDA